MHIADAMNRPRPSQPDPGKRDPCATGILLLTLIMVLLVPRPSSADGENEPSPPRHKITFVQLTDAHIFDEGWKQSTAEALQEAADDRTALHWAVQEINHLVSSGTVVDFVVYTGDFGLQNVDFPRDSNCKALPLQLEPGLPPFTLQSAVNEVTAELEQLLVRRIYFLPGNNDLKGEDVTDRRYDCFLTLLKNRLRSLAQPLDLAALQADSRVDVDGINLVGLNTASFKAMSNYERACSDLMSAKSPALLRQACPQAQIESLRKRVKGGAAAPTLLFTHVPDLKDPYRRTSAWDIKAPLRKTWEDAACSPNVIGIFAGHFHDSDRALYGNVQGTGNLALSKCVAEKTWVAPPLALKNQIGKTPQARGLLLATVSGTNEVRAEVRWFTPAATSQSQPGASSATKKWFGIGLGLLLAIVLAFLLILTVLVWIFGAIQSRCARAMALKKRKGLKHIAP